LDHPSRTLEAVESLLQVIKPTFGYDNVADSYIIKHAQLFILTYCNLNQTACLVNNILDDALPGMSLSLLHLFHE
jgi:hypothetical protein